MSKRETGIEWTDVTWNPVTGCDRVSPGCAHCYALTMAKRIKAQELGRIAKAEREGKVPPKVRYQRDGDPGRSGPGFGVTLHPDVLDRPLRWTRPRRIFVNSMSDLFHPEVPRTFIDDVITVAAMAPQHTFQVLTKRPERGLLPGGQVDPANREPLLQDQSVHEQGEAGHERGHVAAPESVARRIGREPTVRLASRPAARDACSRSVHLGRAAAGPARSGNPDEGHEQGRAQREGVVQPLREADDEGPVAVRERRVPRGLLARRPPGTRAGP